MHFNEYISKIARVLVIIFLCSEMQSSVTQKADFEDRVLYYNSKTNATEASFSNAQHHASIRLIERDQDFGQGHICSGVVIGPSAILTTAHCVYNHGKNKPYHPSELRVVLASLNLYQRQEHTLVFAVTHSYQPATFNALDHKDNVAVLMLERDIPKLNEYVKPITLRQTRISNNNWYGRKNGDELKVTTWLKTNEDLSLNHLMLINASQISDETCIRYYGSNIFTTGMLCVESNESLKMDFGSPLFHHNKLIGVRSFASVQLSPAIYVDVSYHAVWIRSVTGDGSNQNSSIWGTFGFLLFTFVAFKRTQFGKK